MITSPTPLEWLQTLADATRVRLLRLLDREELSVSELCSVVQLPQSTVSRHLKVLSSEAWIESRREANNHFYRVERENWNKARQELWGWVASQATDSPTAQLDDSRLKQVLAERPVSNEFFRTAADRWDALRVELFGRQLDAFALAASLTPDLVVAELGCGSAPLSRLAAPFVQRVIAVDNSSAMLTAAEKQLASFNNVALRAASLEQLPIESSELDLAWLVLVLPYVADLQAVLSEAARVLKANGSLVVIDLLPHQRDEYRLQMGHMRLGIERDELAAWASKSGLEMDRFVKLPPESAARGPALFAAVLKRAASMPDQDFKQEN